MCVLPCVHARKICGELRPSQTRLKMQAAMSLPVWCILLIFNCAQAKIYHNRFAVKIEGGQAVADSVAKDTQLQNTGQIGSLEYFIFVIPHSRRRSTRPSFKHSALLKRHDKVIWFEQQTAIYLSRRLLQPRKFAGKMNISDTYWKHQWHLNGSANGGYDVNTLKAWRNRYIAKNVIFSVLDDGLEEDHPDLVRNYDPNSSCDCNTSDSHTIPRADPPIKTSFSFGSHGTRSAGLISAEANNTKCIVRMSDSRIRGIRMSDEDVYDAVEAASLGFNRSHVDIDSACWASDGHLKVVDGPGKLGKEAFISGIESIL